MHKQTLIFRKASIDDLDAISAIYDRIHTSEEAGDLTTGWKRGIYPTVETAGAAIAAGDMFVEIDHDRIVACGRINQEQVDVYAQVEWEYPADDDEVMVMHTLSVDPEIRHKGYGTAFADFYEKYALECGCRYLRIDTNGMNSVARAMYKRLGYKERGIIP